MGILEDLRWIDIPSNNLFVISNIIDFSRPSDHWYEEFQKNKSLTRSSKYINNLKQLISKGTKIILDCTMEGSLIIDDIREYYADKNATFEKDIEYDDWRCFYF